jgi:hypothetical protein
MAKALKYHPHESVLFCTFSLEERLLPLANPFWKAIIKAAWLEHKRSLPGTLYF